MNPELAEAAEAMARERLAAGHTIHFVARGHSMWPFVLDGDRLGIAPIHGPIRCGDLVWLESGPVHRVIAIGPGPRYWVRGDALLRPDGGFARHEILGRVQKVRRKGRFIPIRASLPTVGTTTLLGFARLLGHIARR